jgi:hypothetical protein
MPKPPEGPAKDKHETAEDKPQYEPPVTMDLGEMEQGQGGLPACVGGTNPAPPCIAGAFPS